MAINEKLITGRKFRRLIDRESKLWQLISWWTKASDVEFDDGKTAEQKLGNINGITSDFSVDDDNIAASSNLTNRAYTRFDEFTDGGKVKRIIIGEDGKPYIEYEDGADTVLKKLGEIDESELTDSISNERTNFTNGTWLLICSSSATTAGKSITLNEKTCSITEAENNYINRIYVKQNTSNSGVGAGEDNNKSYCGLRIYLVNVNTDVADVSLSFDVKVQSYPNESNYYSRLQNQYCRIKISG